MKNNLKNNLKKSSKRKNSNDDFEIVDTTLDEVIEDSTPKIYLTNPIMTSFEKAKLIGVRAVQLDKGDQPAIDISRIKPYNSLKIAELELEMGVIPLSILRYVPYKGKIIEEKWKVRDMYHDNTLLQ